MKVVTFYFSGSGNTKWNMELLNSQLLNKGHESQLYPIQKGFHTKVIEKLINHADYIGFASPLYGADIPKIMRKFMETFDSTFSKTRDVFFIHTHAYVNGKGVYSTVKHFKSGNIRTVAYISIRSFNSVLPSWKVTPIISDKKYNKVINNSKNKLDLLIQKLENKSKWIEGIGPQLLVGMVIRKAVHQTVNNHYKELVVDKDKCDNCMICMYNCPTDSIKKVNDSFVFASHCTSCMKCYNYCHHKAISFGDNREQLIQYRGPEKLYM